MSNARDCDIEIRDVGQEYFNAEHRYYPNMSSTESKDDDGSIKFRIGPRGEQIVLTPSEAKDIGDP